MSNPDPTGFGKFVPGFEFLQKLAQGAPAALPGMAGWVAPTFDPKELDKRIEELKAVQFWLDQNATALKATIQALEVQKMTLAALGSMNIGAADLARTAAAAATATPAAGKPQAQAAPQPAAPSAMPDPMQYWGALTRQFQQIAAGAMQDVAARASAAPAAARQPPAAGRPASKAAGKPASKAARKPKAAGQP